MRTPAEIHLVERLTGLLASAPSDASARILNIGAGQSAFIERALNIAGASFRCDRVDVADCSVVEASVDRCVTCSVEDMAPIESDRYSIAFANYVLEHVSRLDRAAAEVCRVLAPHGRFLTTCPNTAAPEFVLARGTPLAFHRWVRGGEAWETHYAYRGIPDLVAIFEAAGFATESVSYFPFLSGYTDRFPVVRWLGQWYDGVVRRMNARRLMGNVLIAFQKAERAPVSNEPPTADD